MNKKIEAINNYLKRKNITKLDIIYYTIIVGIFLFTRLYKLLVVPYGMHVDEVSMGYNVWSLTEYGVDRYNNPYPVYFNNSGSGQSCLYVYITVLLSKLFGYSLFTLRLTAVLLGGILLLFGTKVALKVSKRFAKIVSLLIVTLPFFITSERFAFDCYAMLPMYVMTFYFFLQLIDTKKTRYAILTGLGIGLTLYSYILACVIVPVFVALALVYVIKTRNVSVRNISIIGVTALLLALPLLYYVLVLLGVVPEFKTEFITISNASIDRVNELKYFHRSLGKLLQRIGILITKDSYDFTSADTGVIYNNTIYLLGYKFSFQIFVVVVAFAVFIYRVIKEGGIRVLALFYGVSTFCIIFFLQNTVIYRHNAFYFFVVFIIAELVDFLIEKRCYIATYLLALCLTINFVTYTHDLLISDNIHYLDYFDNDLLEVCEYIKENDGFKDYTIYVDSSANFSASLMMLYGMRLSPVEFVNSMGSAYDFKTSFSNFKFEVPEVENISRGIYILREYNDNTKLYASDVTDDLTIRESVSRVSNLKKYFKEKGVNSVVINNYSIYRLN